MAKNAPRVPKASYNALTRTKFAIPTITRHIIMIESQQTDFFLSLVVVVVGGGGSDDGDVKWWSLAFPGGRSGFCMDMIDFWVFGR